MTRTTRTRKTLFLGDIHGDWAKLDKAVRIAHQIDPTITEVIQVGDFGFFPHIPNLSSYLYPTPIPISFIDGNHEDHASLQNFSQFQSQYHARYLRRGLIEDGILFMGGAASQDREYRIAGHDWFFQENINYGELDLALKDAQKIPIDIMVCHTTISPIDMGFSKPDQNSYYLYELFKVVRPKLFFHGHFHLFKEYEYEGCQFYSLDTFSNYSVVDDRAMHFCAMVMDGDRVYHLT